jgi:periplasmic protein TonB
MLLADYTSVQLSPARGVGVSASILAHVLLVLFALWVWTWPSSEVSEDVRPRPRYDVVWLHSPGPAGGGGGGGDRTKVASQSRGVGHDSVTVPTAQRAEPRPAESQKPPPAADAVRIPALTMAAGLESVPGIIEAAPVLPTQGAGADGGAGAGTDAGLGNSDGPGLGRGRDGGFGDGAYRGGGGVTSPQIVREVKPGYTAQAMRARVQGIVVLDCVVLPDGSVGDVKIVNSVDGAFGLDDEAIKAARQWRFLPGRRLGEPVAVIVTMELAFSLR